MLYLGDNGSYVEGVNTKYYSSDKTIEEYYRRAEGGLWNAEKKIVKKYFTNRSGFILDIGCGVGRTTIHLHNMGFKIVGIDISEPMIEKAKCLNPSIDFRLGNACDLNFDSEIFDYTLFSFNGIDYIYPEKNRLRVLREINRCLKPGGLFVFSTHNSWWIIPDNLLNPICYYEWLKYQIHWLLSGEFFSKYRGDIKAGKLVTYFYLIDPPKQKKQLWNCGFQLLEIVRVKGQIKYFEAWPYYIAQKVKSA